MKKNEILNYEVLNTVQDVMTVSGVNTATEIFAIIPNAIAAPVMRWHEIDTKKDIAIKVLEHQTKEREKLCDLLLGLAEMDKLDSEKFQTIMVAYGIGR